MYKKISKFVNHCEWPLTIKTFLVYITRSSQITTFLFIVSPFFKTQENSARQARGDPPLPDEDLTKLFKSPQPPLRLESMLMAGQMKNYCTEINKMGASSFGKLFMADALQKDNPTS